MSIRNRIARTLAITALAASSAVAVAAPLGAAVEGPSDKLKNPEGCNLTHGCPGDYDPPDDFKNPEPTGDPTPEPEVNPDKPITVAQPTFTG